MYGLGVGRETRHKCVYSSLKDSLVCAGSSPAQRGPSAVRGTKGFIPGGCQRKEGKKRREGAPQLVTAGPATCRDRVGSPRRSLSCVFSLNTGIWGSLAPGSLAGCIPVAVALGLSPVPAHVTVCTSQTGFGEKEENRECCHFLAMEKKLEN